MPIDPTDPPARAPHIPAVMGLTTTKTPEDDVPTADQVEEDPVALAKRLAAEAKEKAAATAPKEDPVALARRLAAEAKAKAAAAAPKEDPVALARRLAAEAKAKAAAAAPKPTPASSVAAAPKRKKKRTAAEILAEARAKEASGTPKTTRPPKPAPAPVPEPQPEPSPSVAPGLADPTPAADAFDASAVALDLLLGATVERVARPDNDIVLQAVWQAHLARARSTDDAALAATAAAVLGALERLGTEGLAAVEVSYGGASHAIFVDTTRGHVLACATPANVYLAGM